LAKFAELVQYPSFSPQVEWKLLIIIDSLLRPTLPNLVSGLNETCGLFMAISTMVMGHPPTTQAPEAPAIWAPSSLSLRCGHAFLPSLFTYTSDPLRLMHAVFVSLALSHLRTFPAGQFPPHRSHRGHRIG